MAICSMIASAQTVEYTMPEEIEQHEGTWLQWPHNNLYGPWYIDDVEPTFIAMANSLQSGEKVHIIVTDNTELSRITNVLNNASVPMTNIDFYVYPTDDVWSRDNGPMFVYDQNNELAIIDWGFNGWGQDAPFSNCEIIPQSIGNALSVPVIDLNSVVLEGGAIEHDGHGTMIATRSSITHSSRNPSLTEQQIEDSLMRYAGFTNIVWLDGIYGLEITDMHIDGFVKFADGNTIVTMDSLDLMAWDVPANDINTLYNATNLTGSAFNLIYLPLTQNNVITTYNNNLGYKGSYVNYYIGNDVVLVPTYNDPMDANAISILQNFYTTRNVIGVDVRDLYAYGGMIHCVTQQQPVDLNTTGLMEPSNDNLQLLQNSPNPFDELTTITFSLDGRPSVTLDIYNILGQKVKTITPNKGEHQADISAADFENGIYLYTLKVNGQVKGSKKMIINK